MESSDIQQHIIFNFIICFDSVQLRQFLPWIFSSNVV